MDAEQIAITLITPSSYGSKPLWRATTLDGTSWQFRCDDDGGVDTLRLAALAAQAQHNAAVLLGRSGGAATKGISSPAKRRAARRNAKLGGRPRKISD